MGTLAKTSLGLLLAKVSQPLIAFALFGFLARLLPIEAYGLYILILGVLAIFQTGASLGLSPLVIRELAADHRSTGAWIGASAMTMVPISLALWAAFPLFSWLMGYPPQAVTGSLILGASLPVSALIQTAESVFIVHGQTKPLVVQNLLENIFKVGLSIPLILLGHGLESLFCVFVLSRLLALGLLAAPLLRLPHARPLVADRAKARYMLSRVGAFLPLVIVATVNLRTDLLALSVLQGEQAIGYYGPASRLVLMAFLLPDSFISALFPHLARSLGQGSQRTRELVAESTELLLGILLPGCFCLMAVAPELMRLLFGAKFGISTTYFQVLIFVLPGYALTCLGGYLLQSGRKETAALCAAAVTLGLNAALNTAGITFFGTMGAAMATLAATTFGGIVHLALAGRFMFPLGLTGLLLRALLCALTGWAMLFAAGASPGWRALALAGALTGCLVWKISRPGRLTQYGLLLRHNASSS